MSVFDYKPIPLTDHPCFNLYGFPNRERRELQIQCIDEWLRSRIAKSREKGRKSYTYTDGAMVTIDWDKARKYYEEK